VGASVDALNDYETCKHFTEYGQYLKTYGYASVAAYLCIKHDKTKET
jgi:hypothetical protein